MSILSANPLCNPRCRVCHYKDLDYPTQIQRKQQWAGEQLAPWSHVLQEIHPAPESERIGYRSKSWMRASFEEGELSLGMFRSIRNSLRPGHWEKEFISWDTCPLHTGAIQTLLRNLKAEELCNDEVSKSLVGIWFGSPHLVIVSQSLELKEKVKEWKWDRILAPPFRQVWFHCNPQVGKKIFGHHPIESLNHESTSQELVHPIRAFRQIAQSLLREARLLAVNFLIQDQPSFVLDLYCGTGDLSLLLPPELGWLGIELSSEAVKFANSLRDSKRAVHSAYVGAVEHRLNDPQVLHRIEGSYVMYINPPRSGMSEEACESVLKCIQTTPPSKIAYLSCSASSLARDIKKFETSGYRVELLQPFDFFPQTEHFEILAMLKRI